MQFDSVFTVKKEITKETFLREALIEISKESESPIDVVNSTFGEVRESVKEVMLCSAHVESDYTASIGYDRKEQYQTTESRYLHQGDWYTCGGVQKRADYNGNFKVDCVKERIVTDWQPHSGHISGDATCARMNGEDDTSISIVNILKTIKDDSIVEKGEAEVDNESFRRVQTQCEVNVESGIHFPGDHHKDFSSDADITVKSLECYKLPFYEVEYTYNGKKYKVEGFACGELEVAAQTPPNNVNIDAVAERDTKKYKTGKIAGWSAFAGTYVFSWIMFAVGVYWTWFIPILALVAAIVLHITYNKKYSELLRSLKEDNIKLKHAELKGALSKAGYAPLTANEAEYFNEKKGGASYAASHTKKKPTGWAILSGILCVVLLITSLIGGANAKDAKLHSPEQVTISVTSKSQEYKANVSPYTNGCYYIYLDYQISAKDIGIEYIQIKTTVKENGNEIGTIRSSFSSMNLDAGAQKSYQTYLQDNQPEKNNNTFFLTLYDAKYSELSFSFEILSIQFSDGDYYHGNNDFY